MGYAKNIYRAVDELCQLRSTHQPTHSEPARCDERLRVLAGLHELKISKLKRTSPPVNASPPYSLVWRYGCGLAGAMSLVDRPIQRQTLDVQRAGRSKYELDRLSHPPRSRAGPSRDHHVVTASYWAAGAVRSLSVPLHGAGGSE